MKTKMIGMIGICLMFLGCNGINSLSNSAISSKKLSDSSVIDIIDKSDKAELRNDSNEELYFADTHNKIFYSKGDKNYIGFRVKTLLRALFNESRYKLPKISRRKKLNIALEVGDKKLLKPAQNFIISNRRYNLSNTDKKTMQILKQVLKREKDSIYKGRTKITTKSKSDVVLYINTKKNKDNMVITAKLISKNGTILGIKSTTIYLNKNKNNSQWVEVFVPRNDAPAQAFKVMKNAVTQNQYYGNGNKDVSVSNITFEEANDFCQRVMKAELISLYVFENARKTLSISRPTSPVDSEIIAPYDEEDDAIYYMPGDHVESEDGNMVLFDWNSEKYYSISNIYHSKKTSFRCMKAE